MITCDTYEIVNHGMEHEQYFQGCGVACTHFEHCATGIGDNPAAAMDDAMEQIAQNGVDVVEMEQDMLDAEEITAWPTTPEVCDGCEWADRVDDDGLNPCESCDKHYYVSIRYNASK